MYRPGIVESKFLLPSEVEVSACWDEFVTLLYVRPAAAGDLDVQRRDSG